MGVPAHHIVSIPGRLRHIAGRLRSRTRRESPLTSSVLSSLASSSRMAAPFRITTSRRSRPSIWCFASKVLAPTNLTHGRSHRQDALEVEEEEDASPSAPQEEDAPEVQVNPVFTPRRDLTCQSSK